MHASCGLWRHCGEVAISGTEGFVRIAHADERQREIVGCIQRSTIKPRVIYFAVPRSFLNPDESAKTGSKTHYKHLVPDSYETTTPFNTKGSERV